LYLQTSGAIRLYTLQYHIIIFDKFCWSLSFPRAVSTLTFCASFAASSPKVQCKRPVELPDFWPPNNPGLSSLHFITKSVAASLPQKVQDVNDLRRHLFDAWVGVALLTMTLISGADVLCLYSSYRRMVSILTVI